MRIFIQRDIIQTNLDFHVIWAISQKLSEVTNSRRTINKLAACKYYYILRYQLANSLLDNLILLCMNILFTYKSRLLPS